MKDNKYKPLIIFIVVIWTLVLSLIILLVVRIKHQEVKLSHIEQEIEVLVEEPEEKTSSILEQSIAVCKNEYAVKIAHAVIREYERQGAPIPIIYALIGTESDKTKTSEISIINCGNFKPWAESGKNCRGLTQVHYDTLCDFNTFNKYGHKYTWDDMFDIDKNIEVGVWHYMRYTKYVGYDWINLYIIYNAGYGNYTRENKYWIYNPDTFKWETHRSDWYYRNHKYPPEDVNLSFIDLTTFSPTRRFEIYLDMYTELFA